MGDDFYCLSFLDGHKFAPKPIDPIIRDSLELIKFKCPVEGCDEVFPYLLSAKHARLCLTQPAVLCVLNCEQKMLIKGAQRMEEHLLDVCCNMKGACANCKQVIVRSDLDTHVC
jgi:hypothetical protein